MVGSSNICFRKLSDAFWKSPDLIVCPCADFASKKGKFKFLVRTRICDLDTFSRFLEECYSFIDPEWLISNKLLHTVTFTDFSDSDLHIHWDSHLIQRGAL